MQFKSTLVGAVIGAAIGVILHCAIEIFGRIEAPWFAIVIGLLVGLLVRRCDTTCAGHVSYVRGAIAGVIALSAIVGSTYLLGVALTNQAALANEKLTTDSAEPNQDVHVDGAPDDEAKQTSKMESSATVTSRQPAIAGGIRRTGNAGEFSLLQFVFIAVGTFIAYELGRGTEGKAPSQQSTAESLTAPVADGN